MQKKEQEEIDLSRLINIIRNITNYKMEKKEE